MNMQKTFDPQISPINADGSGRYLVGSHHLPGEPRSPATVLSASSAD
ncbi:MAG: hypothetical protein HYY97_08335 [Rhodocyclales bacterium]|nr:hypothetical protein [Rhodocyclales bacterium]